VLRLIFSPLFISATSSLIINFILAYLLGCDLFWCLLMVVECPSTDIAASDPAWVIELFVSCVDEEPNEGTIAHLIILIKFVTDSRI